MKKLFVISLVFVLLAVSAVPAFAGNGKPNDHANGAGNGLGNSMSNGPGNGNGNANGHNQENRGFGNENAQNKWSNDTNPKFKNQENTKWMYTPFYLQGTITSVDAGAMTLVVNVYHANAKVKEFMGTDLTITANAGTQIFQITQGNDENTGDDSEDADNGDDDGNRVPITFDQLEVGQVVAIHGRLVDTAYTARLITVYINQPMGENP